MKVRRLGAVGLGAMAVAVVLSGCGSSRGGVPAAGSSSPPQLVSVVASTDVWGDVVKQVAGSLAGGKVQITSIISDPAADPHSYEASTQTLLALSKANVVVENGGGYDDFVDTMLRSANNPSATVLNAVEVSGKTAPPDGDLNEHVWYDFPTVRRVAGEVVDALSAVDPADAAVFRSNASAFDRELASMERTEAAIKEAYAGDGVAITEPVPLYMLTACGLDNETPPEFSRAIEEGTDVSPAVLKETEDLFNARVVKLLAYNEQTAGPETEAVLRAARANNIGVVPVTETLPSGQDYPSWMRSNLAAIRSALGG
jgi:zinc/manganese transport system substrate-binding protein